jgi:hypothetical protein
MNIPTESVRNIIYKSTITNLETTRNSEVASNKFNVDRISSPTQKQQKVLTPIVILTTM